MTPGFLLAELRSIGVTVVANGDKLRFSPKELMTDSLLQELRDHKAELIAELTKPTNSRPVTDFSTWRSHVTSNGWHIFESPDAPKRWRDTYQIDPPIGAGFPPYAAKPLGEKCTRCRSDEFVETPIHDGRSTRRDCKRCGRFHSFSKWNGNPK